MSILITGGGSGIGAGAARYFSELGAKVTICGRREVNLKQVSKEIGPNCFGIRGDVSIAKQRAKVLDSAVRHGNGLDVLINCAANMLRGSISDLKESISHKCGFWNDADWRIYTPLEEISRFYYLSWFCTHTTCIPRGFTICCYQGSTGSTYKCSSSGAWTI